MLRYLYLFFYYKVNLFILIVINVFKAEYFVFRFFLVFWSYIKMFKIFILFKYVLVMVLNRFVVFVFI